MTNFFSIKCIYIPKYIVLGLESGYNLVYMLTELVEDVRSQF